MARLFFALGSTLGLIGVAAGAFGAHALRNYLTPELLDIWETAVRYQLVHALVGREVSGDSELLAAVERGGRHVSDAEAAIRCLERCLDARAQVEANANQATLIECWLDDLGRLKS